MPQLAVLILTFNEKQHIEDCIKSASFADEIVVIDSGSIDETVSMAKALGAKVIHHPMEDGFAAQRNFALTCTNADWVFYLDADERVTEELAREICSIVDKNKSSVWAVPRRFMMYGKWTQHGGLYPDYTARLFHQNSKLKWQGTIHESAEVSLPIQKLNHALLHYGFRGWESHIQKDNRYTSMLAKKLYSEGKRGTLLDIVIHPTWAFIRMYFLRGGWCDGLHGFILAWFRVFYVLQKYVKLYYMDRNPLEGSK